MSLYLLVPLFIYCYAYIIPFQVLVVSNAKAVKKIPPVPGLLLYSPGNEQLFVQGKTKWNMIAMEGKASISTLFECCK